MKITYPYSNDIYAYKEIAYPRLLWEMLYALRLVVTLGYMEQEFETHRIPRIACDTMIWNTERFCCSALDDQAAWSPRTAPLNTKAR